MSTNVYASAKPAAPDYEDADMIANTARGAETPSLEGATASRVGARRRSIYATKNPASQQDSPPIWPRKRVPVRVGLQAAEAAESAVLRLADQCNEATKTLRRLRVKLNELELNVDE